MYNISFQYVQGSIGFASLVKTTGTYGKSAMGQESSTPNIKLANFPQPSTCPATPATGLGVASREARLSRAEQN